MSAIGDFIHLTAFGYQKHGITKDGKYSTYGFNKAAFLSGIPSYNQKDLKEYQKAINSVRNVPPLEENEKATTTAMREIATQINNTMIKRFKLAGSDLDLSKGKINYRQQTLKDAVGSIKVKGQKGNYSLYKNYANTGKKINKLLDILDRVPQKSSQLENRITQIKKVYKDIFKETTKAAADRGYTTNSAFLKNIDYQSLPVLKEKANALISQYASYPAVNFQQGTFFENILGAAGALSEYQGNKTVQQVIEQAVLGDTNVKIDFDKSIYRKGNTSQAVAKTFGNTTVQASQSWARSKVDVRVAWKPQSVFNISAKSVYINKNSSTRAVTLVSGSPLLAMVQNIDMPLVNHYLNLFSIHYQGEGAYSNGLTSFDNDKSIQNNGKQVLEYMRNNLFKTALVGRATNSKDIVNIFAVNDKNTGNIRLIPVSTLLESVVEGKIKPSVSYNGKSMSNYVFKNNKRTSSTDARIQNILNEMHQLKVHVAFNVMNKGVFNW